MTRFNPDSSFVSSLMRGRHHHPDRHLSRKEMVKALLAAEHPDRLLPAPSDDSSAPTPKNVLDRSR